MTSEWVFRSLARRWFGGSTQRRAGGRPRHRSRGTARPLTPRLEALEDRTLLSVLPAPLTTGHPDVSLTASPQSANENSPSVAYDPLNPNHLVAVWSSTCTGLALSEIDMAFSANGGQTWSAYKGTANPSNACNPGAPIVSNPIGPDIEDPQNQPFIFSYAVTPSVAFDRAHTFYVVYEDVHAPSLAGTTVSGAVVLKKFDFSGGAPTPITFSKGQLTKSLYAWSGQGTPGQDPALNPTLAVDSNLPNILPDPANPNNGPPVAFVDPTTGATQSDPLANSHVDPTTGLPDPNFDQLYVSWNQHNVLPASPQWGLVQVLSPEDSNPDVVRLIGSNDGGNTFTPTQTVNDGLPDGIHSGVNYGNPNYPNLEHDANPVLTISQGTSSDRAGETALRVKSLTNSGTTAKVVTLDPLPFWVVTGSQVTVAGASPNLYDGTWVVSVDPAIPNTFTYQLLTTTAPGTASGTITARPIENPGGQLSVAWNDFGNNQIVTDRVLNGGSGAFFNGGLTGSCDGFSDICENGSSTGSFTTLYTLDLSKVVAPAGFGTVSNLGVELSLFHPHMNQLRIDLISPSGDDIILAIGADYFPPPLKFIGMQDHANLGEVHQGNFFDDVGTIFDDSATRFLDDPNATVPWAASFQPMNNNPLIFNAGFPVQPDSLQAFDGLKLTDPAVAGVWTLAITEDGSDTVPAPGQFVNRWELHFASGQTTNQDRIAVKQSPTNPGPVIAGSFYAPYPDQSVPAIPDRGVSPRPSLAVDNSLGSYSPNQGRLYLAYTSGVNTQAFGFNGAFSSRDPSPNIYLATSDDGGLSWTQPVQVNDDSVTDPATGKVLPQDNFSTGTRAHFEPNVAVDAVTGTLVVTWYDARYDAANARVATFMATSLDGGWKPDPSGNGRLLPDFSPNVYLNAPRQALNDAQFDPTTGGHSTITLEPIPDNQSTGNPGRDTTWDFGDHQALTVYGGHVHALWSGNEDGGPRLNSLDANGVLVGTDNLDILTSDTIVAVGPRIVSSTLGPVQEKQVTTDDGRTISFNNTYATENGSGTVAGGTQQVNGFVVTFDRPVDVGTVTPDEVSVLFRDTATQANSTPPNFGGQFVDPTTYQITPLDGYTTRYGPAKIGGLITDLITGLLRPILATEFLVTFAAQAATGTYSYSVGPGVRDGIRQPNLLVVHGAPVFAPGKEPHATDTPIAIPPDAANGDTGGPGTPHTVSTISVSGFDPKLQVTHVTVRVRINHTLDSDMVIKLIGPDGTTAATLAEHNGNGMDFGTSSPNRNGPTITSYTTFDDLALTSINLGSSPFSGSFVPESALSVFEGAPVNGAWKLDIADTVQQDVGTLIDWSLSLDAGFPLVQTGLGNKMDQNGDALTADTILPLGAADPADTYAVPRPLNGVPFALPYDTLTLPLSVPGPHLVSTFVPGLDAQGNPLNPPTPDNLVVNGTVHAIDVVFDRDMDPTTFTTADLLTMAGPIGSINLFDPITHQPLPGVYVKADPNPAYPRLINGQLTTAADPDPLHPRTFQIGLPTDPLAPAGTVGEDLSGTYSLTLAPGILSKTGEAVDTNLNAGYAVLNGNDPTSTNLVAGGVSHDSGPISVTVKSGTTASATIAFAEAFQVRHAQVLLNITSPDARDLTGFLVSPTGAKILLFSGAGGVPRPGQQTGFLNTTIDDRGAATIQPDSNGNGPAQPFRGIFSPAQPLSTLDGTSSGGTWQLEIINNGPQTHTATITEWRLTLDESQLGTGLGEPVADQADVHFRIFTMDPTNPLSHNTWTAVGPASQNRIQQPEGTPVVPESGQIGAIAVDPSDPSGNTVYVAGASGGIWKTTNFLTTDPGGPTYVPLTDFGPTFGINVGGLAVFGQNNDPRQSVIFAATGAADNNLSGHDTNHNDSANTGVGFLRSTDGGVTWTLLDSTVNVDGSGNLLPINSPLRDHAFVNTASFKVVVDPVRTPSGNIAIFAALEGVNGNTNGGIWRSLDNGNTWENVLPGQATDVTLAPFTAFDANNPAAPPGNAQVVYAALAGGFNGGVYFSPNEGNTGTWLQMTGAGFAGGGDPLLRSPSGQSIPANSGATPNGSNGRILLATPALTGDLIPGQPYVGNRALDLIYQNWLYALVITSGNNGSGNLQGLYLTKDRGRNWTQVKIPAVGGANPTNAVPTNDETKGNVDPFAQNNRGNFDASLAVDPNNPAVVYVGGNVIVPFPVIRIDTTTIHDPYNVVSYDASNNDGGTMQSNAAMSAAVNTTAPGSVVAGLQLKDPATGKTIVVPYLNALRDPNNVFLNNATRLAANTNSFLNDGTDVSWGFFGGTAGVYEHRVLSLRDPLTGKTRLIFGDNLGVWTSLDNGPGTPTGLGPVLTHLGGVTAANGTVLDPGVKLVSGGTQGDRNGNLQLAQVNYGAAQPSALAAQIGQALFYANAAGGQGFPVSDPNLLTNGNLTWNGPTGDGGGIATDQTGAGSVYTYQSPGNSARFDATGQVTDFFSVDPNGNGSPSEFGADGTLLPYPSRTTGLVETNNPGQVPDAGWPFNSVRYGNDLTNSNVAVNPMNGDDLLISSADTPGAVVGARIFRSGDQGVTWTAILIPFFDPLGRPATQLNTGNFTDGTYAPALAFGPADPVDPSSRPDLNFLFVGTMGGHAYVTVDGGGHWFDISAGLDGSPVLGISANPKPGSHEAYAVTEKGVYHLTFTVSYSTTGIPMVATTPAWTSVTGNLFGISHNAFNNPNFAEPYLLDPNAKTDTTPETQGGGLTALAVDWRYVIPDNPAVPNGSTHPLLYVGGDAGVFRTADAINPGGAAQWTIFPDALPVTAVGPDGLPGDGAPVDGGFLPLAHVTSLSLSVGNINPASGLPDQPTGPNLLYATTYGRGTYAIRLPLSSAFNTVLGPRVASAVAINTSNAVLPNPVNQTVGLDTLSLDFSGTIDPSTFTLDDLQLSGPRVASITRVGTTATVTMQQPDGFVPGDRIVLAGANETAYDGSFTIATIVDARTFTIAVTGNPATPASGTISVLRALEVPVASLTSTGTTATVTTTAAHGYNVGDRVIIAGASPAAYDGTFTITGVPTSTTFTYTVVPGLAPATGTITADELPIRQLVNLSGQTTPFAVQSITRVGTTATVTTSGPNGFVSGDQVMIAGASDAGYDGTFTIISTGLNTFTYTVASSLPAKATGTITATRLTGPSANNLWKVELVHQSAYGNYNLTVGPNITDYAGHPMDQDGDDNGGGGNPDDPFTTTFTIAGLQVVGVVAPANPVPTPPGLSAIVVNFNTLVDPASFDPTKPGVVTLVGPKGPVTIVSAQDVSGNAADAALLPANVADHAWQLNLQSSQLTPGTYTLTIGPNLSDTGNAMGGSEHLMDQNENAVYGEPGVAPAGDQFQSTFTIQGLRVVSVAPSLQLLPASPVLDPPGLSSATITFNREVAAASFTAAALSLTGPSGTTVPVTNIVDLTLGNTNRHDTWEIDFAGQTTPGIYTLVIGPNITDSTGTPMDQDADGISGAVPDDQDTVQFDVGGLQVLTLTPSGPVPLPIGQDSVTLTFNQGVLPATMNATNVTLTGPAGNVPLTKFTDLNPATHTKWELDFAKQSAYGTYTVTVGTGVEDLAGEPMNQNQDTTFGGPNDSFMGTFIIGGLHVVTVTPPTGNPVLAPPGLTSMTVTFYMPVDPTSFTSVDVQLTGPDGSAIPFALADVTPGTAPPHTVWQVTPLDASNNPTAESTPGVYTLVVGPNINDVGGNAMDQNQNGIHGEPFVSVTNPGDASVSQFDVQGLAVLTATPAGTTPLPPGQSSVTLTFNQAVLTSSMNASNLTLTGPVNVGNVPLTGFVDLTLGNTNKHDRWEVDFAAQTTPGTYVLNVGPGVEDLAHNPMNQNGNTIFGENPGDVFTSSFVIDGLHITTIAPDPSQPYLEPPALGAVTVTFNREVNQNTFGTSDVTFTGPNGKIPVLLRDITPTGATFAHSVWQIYFNPQSQAGIYTIIVGPHISDGDPFSTEMDQNENLVYGEPFVSLANPGDAFVATYDIDGLRVVPPVLPQSPVPLPVGLSSVTVTFNQAVMATTFNANTVSLNGPKGNVPLLSFTDLTLGNTNTHTQWKVAFVSGLTAFGTYTLTISPAVQDLAGHPMNQNANEVYGEASDGFQSTFQIGGLEVLASQVTPPTNQPVLTPAGLSSITLPFNMEVQPGSFTTADIILRRPDGSTVAPIMLTDKTLGTSNPLHNLWELDFTPQTVAGVYTLTVGPNIDDVGSHLMDQDQDGVFGDSGDAFVAKFSVDGLAVVTATPPIAPVAVASITSSNTVATVTTATPHGFTSGDQVIVRGANESGYDGTVTITVVDALTFTYAVPASTPPAATGTISATKLTQAGLTDETITFNQAVLPGSLNANTVALTGPTGNVSLLKFADITTGSPNMHNIWDVSFAALTTPGVYTLTVGPGVEDLAGNAMNQNHNPSFGDPGVAPAGDAYQTTFVIDGLHVTSVTPSLAAPVPGSPGLSSVTVTFNREVNPATFVPADLQLLAPDNTPITGLTLTDITSTVPFSPPNSVWKIVFPAQTKAGVYTLVVGPHISDQDPLGRQMDQNENQIYGEPFVSVSNPGDAFVAQFDVAGLQIVSTTPVAGANLPAGTTAIDLQFNQGVLASTMNASNLTLAATFAVKSITNNGTLALVTTVSPTGFVTGDQVTIAGANETGYNGTYTIAVTGSNTFTYTLQSAPPSPATGTITVAPTKPIALTAFKDLTLGTTNPTHDRWEIDFKAQRIYGTYTLTVSSAVEDLAGNPMNQNGNTVYGEPGVAPFGDGYQTSFHINGLQVASVTPATSTLVLSAQGGLSSATVTFNMSIDSTTFDASDVTLTLPNGNTVGVTSVTDITGAGSPPASVWKVVFPAQTTPGVYALTVLPNIKDLGGNLMDQNLNGIGGEPADAFTAQLDVDGLVVTSVTPSGPTPLRPGVGAVTVSFNQAVLASSMNASNLTLTGPVTVGNVPLTGFQDLTLGTTNTHDRWEVDFAPEAVPGTYTLLLGPGIQDLAGNAMNQNKNTVPGESGLAPVGDQDQSTFIIDGLRVVSVSPPPGNPAFDSFSVQSLTSVVPVQSLTSNGTVATVTTLSSTALVTGDPVTIAGADQSGYDGTFTVLVTSLNTFTYTLPSAQPSPATGTITANTGTLANVVTNSPNAFATGDRVTISGADQPGYDGTFIVAVTGPSVFGYRLPAAQAGPATGFITASTQRLSSVTITFNREVDPTTFTTADLTLTRPDGSPITTTNDGNNNLTLTDLGAAPAQSFRVQSLTSSGTLATVTTASATGLANGDQVTISGANEAGYDGTFPITVTGAKTFTYTLASAQSSPATGTITAGTLAGLADSLWRVAFAPQKGIGVYTLKVGPHIADSTGTEMDQNENQIYGEPGDAFTGKFDVGGLQVVAVSPVPAGSAPAGLSSVVITFNQAVLTGSLGANTVMITDPNGRTVPIVGFNVRSNTPNVVEVRVAPLTTLGAYTLTVGPGVQDLAGNAMNQNNNNTFGDPGVTVAGSAVPGGDGFQTSFTVARLQVVAVSPPANTPLPGLSSIVLTFNMGVNPSTFSPGDVVLTAPNGATIPVAVTDLTAGITDTHDRWEVDFAPQTGQGTYLLTVLPNLLDNNGNSAVEYVAPFVVGAASPPPNPGGPPTLTPITGLEITGLVQLVPSKIKKGKGRFRRQTVQILNTSGRLIQGPFVLIVDGLPRKVHLFSANGFTSTAHGPSGHPYQMLFFTANQLNSLQGGTFTLVYTNPAGKKFAPTFRLLAGITNP
jgi:subtilisin-like proprotein convertase family protein